LSNLIKSGKVVEVGIPVNVGVSYSFNNSKGSIVEKVSTISKATSIKKEEKVENNSNQTPQNNIENYVSQEEMLKKYMEEAQKKADEHYKAEMQKAYEEGIIKANEEAKAIIENAKIERENILDEIVKLKEEVALNYKEEIKNAEKDLLELSLDIVEKIINYEVDRSDNYVLGIVKDSLDRVMNKKDVVLKLSTADYYTVVSNKKYLMTNVKGFGEVDIIQDESLDPGTCIVDTPLGVIDGSIQVRMDNIQKEVMKILNE